MFQMQAKIVSVEKTGYGRYVSFNSKFGGIIGGGEKASLGTLSFWVTDPSLFPEVDALEPDQRCLITINPEIKG